MAALKTKMIDSSKEGPEFKSGRDALVVAAKENDEWAVSEKATNDSSAEDENEGSPGKKQRNAPLVLTEVPLSLLFDHMVIESIDGSFHRVTVDEIREGKSAVPGIAALRWGLKHSEDGLRATLVKLSHVIGFGYTGIITDTYNPLYGKADDKTLESEGKRKNATPKFAIYESTTVVGTRKLLNFLASGIDPRSKSEPERAAISD